MDSQSSIEKLVALGLTEYKAERLVKLALEENMTLQKAYYESYCRIFRADMALLGIFLFFFISIYIGDDHEGLVVLAFMVFIGVFFEIIFRFHKGCWQRLKIYRGLKGL